MLEVVALMTLNMADKDVVMIELLVFDEDVVMLFSVLQKVVLLGLLEAEQQTKGELEYNMEYLEDFVNVVHVLVEVVLC